MDTVDPTVTLAAIASAQNQFQLACCYSIAKATLESLPRIMSLDHLSRGRVVFGAGLGEPPNLNLLLLNSSAKMRAKKLMKTLQCRPIIDRSIKV